MSKIDKKLSGATKKEAILDAAEHVFADKGFYGATIREIFLIANANSGLMKYYFETKENLFSEVIMRRCAEFEVIFNASMDDLLNNANGTPTLDEVCLAYTRFFLRLAYDSGDGWHNYLKLLANANSVYDEAAVGALLARFSFILTRTAALIRLALPAAREDAVEKSLLYLEAATTTVLLSAQLVSSRIHLSTPLHSEDIADDMAHFFSRAILNHCM
jgi:AcrR family transcriptional regulator